MSETTFHVRDASDLIAVVPLTLGFHPEDSLVMLTMGPRQFHARLDLPRAPGGWDAAAETLIQPCLRHHTDRVMFLIYSDTPDLDLGDFLDAVWSSRGIEVLEIVFVQDDTYLAIKHGSPGWCAYTLDDHAITLEGSLLERTPRDQTREAMTERVRPGAAEITYSDTDVADAQDVSVEELRKWITAGLALDAGHMTEILQSLAQQDWRNHLIATARRDEAPAMLSLWIDVLRATEPESSLAHRAAELAGYFAWRSGNGAIAWACHDHCEPTSPIAIFLGQLLTNAVDPGDWDPHDHPALLASATD